MPPKTCECGAGPGYGHAEGCFWRGSRGDVMAAPCPHPGCGAGPGEPCKGRKTSGVHIAREASQDPRNPILAISEVLTKIKTNGREGHHDADDDDCGCGRCCSLLVLGLEAGMEGRIEAGKAKRKP